MPPVRIPQYKLISQSPGQNPPVSLVVPVSQNLLVKIPPNPRLTGVTRLTGETRLTGATRLTWGILTEGIAIYERVGGILTGGFQYAIEN